jgi:hypothetical protein
MARLAGEREHELNVVVDVDVRLGCRGGKTGEAALSSQIGLGELKLVLMDTRGGMHFLPGPEKDQVVHTALKRLIDTKAMIEREGTFALRSSVVVARGDFSVALGTAGCY